MREINLTQGKIALVDDEDWEFLHLFKWCAMRQKHTFYAMRGLPRPGGGKTIELMHRLVLVWALGRDIVSGMQCDHIDGDGINNQRYNLREVTRRGNAENKHIVKSSQYLGVSWDKCGKWQAQIKNGKKVHLGRHATELAAALAREAYIGAHPELGARSNFPRHYINSRYIEHRGT